MEDLLQLILDRELSDFRGTEIKGRLVIGDELINELLGEVMAAAATPAGAADTGAAAGADEADAPPSVDVRQLLSLLTIRQLRYRTEAGRTVLELDVGV